MELLITAIYTAPFVRVTMDYMDDGSVDYIACGEVSDEQIQAMIAAGGGSVPGFSRELI